MAQVHKESMNAPLPLKYDPNRLLDSVIDMLHLKNDAALCRLVGVAQPVVSKIRNRRHPVGGSFLIALHEETGLSIGALRALMGDRRKIFRGGSHIGAGKRVGQRVA